MQCLVHAKLFILILPIVQAGLLLEESFWRSSVLIEDEKDYS
jgi:hypothetical protein